MALTLTPVSAAYFSAVIGALLYGIFLVLFSTSSVLHVQRIVRANRKANRAAIIGIMIQNPMIVAGFALFLTVTARWILDVIDTSYGFLESQTSEQTFVYFIDVARPRSVAGIGIFIGTLMICDAMIVYRLWIVWNRSTLIVIFPIFTLLGMLTSGIGVTHQLAVTPLGDSPFENKVGRWIVSDSVFNLLTNIYSTGLISWRIYSINSRAAAIHMQGGVKLTSITATLIESSAILSVWILFEMITYGLKSALQPFVITTLGTVSGISFMLINVRVSLGWAQTNPTTYSTTTRTYPVFAARVQMDSEARVDTTKGSTNNGYELDGVTVRKEQLQV